MRNHYRLVVLSCDNSYDDSCSRQLPAVSQLIDKPPRAVTDIEERRKRTRGLYAR
jgi:hypothetical protein